MNKSLHAYRELIEVIKLNRVSNIDLVFGKFIVTSLICFIVNIYTDFRNSFSSLNPNLLLIQCYVMDFILSQFGNFNLMVNLGDLVANST